MAMKEKNSFPDMYSPEKKFSGFLCIWSAGTEDKNRKRTYKINSKKKEPARPPASLHFILLHISHIVKKAAGKAAA